MNARVTLTQPRKPDLILLRVPFEARAPPGAGFLWLTHYLRPTVTYRVDPCFQYFILTCTRLLTTTAVLELGGH